MMQRKFDDRRRALKCPCGRSNADGKFRNFVGSLTEGFCYKCNQTFTNKNNKPCKNVTPQIVLSDYFDTIEAVVMRSSFDKRFDNSLSVFLFRLFGEDVTKEILIQYNVGTAQYWINSTVFWQVDQKGLIRAGKIMQYQLKPCSRSWLGINCSRVKTNKPPIYWVHSLLNKKDFKLKQCFFGEHLIRDGKTICVVESEKTALIAKGYQPDCVWIATGGSGGLKAESLIKLWPNRVILWPDLGVFEQWSKTVLEIKKGFPGFEISVSNLLEKIATEDEKKSGMDLADFLLRQSPSKTANKGNPT